MTRNNTLQTYLNDDLIALTSDFEPALRPLISEKLMEIKVIEKEVPAVIIISNLRTDSVFYMSQRGLDILGTTLKDIRIHHKEYTEKYFNPEDIANIYPKPLELAQRNNMDELITFFHQIRHYNDKDWTWYLCGMKIFCRDLEDKPLLMLTLAMPIESKSHITTKVERLIHENNFLRNNTHIFASLGKREKEILKLMAMGLNSKEIADKTFIAEATALTHRRNIKRKLNAETTYDITRFAQAFDLI